MGGVATTPNEPLLLFRVAVPSTKDIEAPIAGSAWEILVNKRDRRKPILSGPKSVATYAARSAAEKLAEAKKKAIKARLRTLDLRLESLKRDVANLIRDYSGKSH